jgi:hypothetical protein
VARKNTGGKDKGRKSALPPPPQQDDSAILPVNTEEHEVKFESRVNLQLKYSIIDKPEDFRRKFECLLGILNLPVHNVRTQRLEDFYYDDDVSSIRNAGWSIRIRQGEGGRHAYVVTIKSNDRTPAASGLHREWPFTSDVSRGPRM